MNGELKSSLDALYEQKRALEIRIEELVQGKLVEVFLDDGLEWPYNVLNNCSGELRDTRYVIDCESRVGAFFIGYAGELPNFDVNKKALFFIGNNNYPVLVCELSTGRKLPDTESTINDFAFLDSESVIVRNISIGRASEYLENTGKDTKRKQYNKLATHVMVRYFVFDGKIIDELGADEGKTAWQNTPQYLARQEQEKINHERNMKRKTEPSALSKEEKQKILCKYGKK